MILNIYEPEKTSFSILSMYHTFIWKGEVYLKISKTTAVDIANKKDVPFEETSPISPCLISEMYITKEKYEGCCE